MSKTRHEFNSNNTKLLAGIREMVEDGVGEAVKHMQEPTTVEGKPCTLTFTVTVTPNKGRDLFTAEVKRSVKFSPKESFGTTLAAPASSNGDVEISEYNPQVEIPFK